MPEAIPAPYLIIEDGRPREVSEAEYFKIKSETIDRLTETGFLGTLRSGKGIRKIEGIEPELNRYRKKFLHLLTEYGGA